MEIEMRVSCDEMVKPSSPTPQHLRFYSFSFLDQLAPPTFLPFVLFYENKTNLSNRERADHLKTSLSQMLSLFYPLAGRIKNTTGVECNDEGVRFVEAKASCKMSKILENPDPNDHNKFLTFEYDEVSDIPLTVQLTFFDCGGLAIGVGLCHKLCDALAGFNIIKIWTAFARGDSHTLVTPCFDLAKLFPPCDMGDLIIAPRRTNENLVTKRLVFSKSSIESLRERFSGNKEEFRATRVEALSGFLWSRYMASKADDKIGKIYAIMHPVNLRKYANPIIPENMFGNILGISVTIPKEDEERRSLVQQMRDGIGKIDAKYVKELQEDGRRIRDFLIAQASAIKHGQVVMFVFSSLCRFPVYEADFGWGKPSWVSSAKMSHKNVVLFMDTKEGDGIEASINLEEKDMSRFEEDEELLSYVS